MYRPGITLSTSTCAPFLFAQAVVPHMRDQRFGRMVFISSVAAGAGPRGVTVNAVAPGLIETDMLAGGPRRGDIENHIPVGRLGRPAEVADVVAAVAGNAFMTVQTVSVDGGIYPR
jgi:3-oxoacyl-[acyl-carrier protein] reductase